MSSLVRNATRLQWLTATQIFRGLKLHDLITCKSKHTNVSPLAHARNICCGHKFCVRDTKNVSDLIQKHFVSATNVSQFAQPKKHEQQCVRNNVSAFARALKGHSQLVHMCIRYHFMSNLHITLHHKKHALKEIAKGIWADLVDSTSSRVSWSSAYISVIVEE